MPANQIQYSEKYYDDVYEYRHVVLPQDIAQLLPKGRLLSESEWRSMGVQQSRGWVHYAIHRPEPHIMLFRRPKNYQQNQVTFLQTIAHLNALCAAWPTQQRSRSSLSHSSLMGSMQGMIMQQAAPGIQVQ